MMFDSYKTVMKGDISSMQNRYVLEGRFFKKQAPIPCPPPLKPPPLAGA
jgi:hypothetical protein